MDIKAGQYRYAFDGDYLRSAAIWDKDPLRNPDAVCYSLTHLSPADMGKLHEKMREDGKEVAAMPIYISNINRELWLYPIPDQDRIAQVRYETIHTI